MFKLIRSIIFSILHIFLVTCDGIQFVLGKTEIKYVKNKIIIVIIIIVIKQDTARHLGKTQDGSEGILEAPQTSIWLHSSNNR